MSGNAVDVLLEAGLGLRARGALGVLAAFEHGLGEPLEQVVAGFGRRSGPTPPASNELVRRLVAAGSLRCTRAVRTTERPLLMGDGDTDRRDPAKRGDGDAHGCLGSFTRCWLPDQSDAAARCRPPRPQGVASRG